MSAKLIFARVDRAAADAHFTVQRTAIERAA
jgi:hypothetical protein